MDQHMPDFLAVVLARVGYAPDHIQPGKLERFTTSQRRSDKAGYCKLWPDGLGGFYGDFRAGIFGTWSAVDRGQMSPSDRWRHERQMAQARAERDAIQRERWAKNRQRLRELWRAAQVVTQGDPVARYLAGRGLGQAWPVPACLRYHPCLPYWSDGELIGTFPAMLATFRGASGGVVALHQTFLTRDGLKADVPSVKKISPAAGLLMGGCIALAEPRDAVLGIAEGIETALCAGVASGLPVVAAYSAGCLTGYQWPKQLTRLVIFGDNDANGTGQAAAQKLATRARTAGVSVSVLIPQKSGTDWADVVEQHTNTQGGGL